MADVLSSCLHFSSHRAEQTESICNEGEQPDFAAAGQVHPVNRLRRHLSRTITQPRGLYESVIETFGPITAPDIPQVEAAQVEEAYQNLHVSDVSDTGTCSSYEDGAESHHTPVDDIDRNECLEVRHVQENSQDLRTRGKTKPRKLSDAEWAKSILGRRTGYGCLQRNQVVKYISQLESSLLALQTEILALSPQVNILDQHRWILQGENDDLKHKISELSYDQLLKEDQHSALQKELQLLRLQQLQQQQYSNLTSDEVSNAGEGTDLRNIQQREHDSVSSFKEVQNAGEDDGKPMKPSLVKWPSSLYRSVSSIRNDVLEIQECTQDRDPVDGET